MCIFGHRDNLARRDVKVTHGQLVVRRFQGKKTPREGGPRLTRIIRESVARVS